MWRLLPITVLLALGLACQAPFGRDRHDLVDDRIAAITTAPTAEGVAVAPILVIDGRLYADDARPEVTWSSDGADPVTGYPAVLPLGPTTWTVEVAFPSGDAWTARLTLPEAGPAAMPAPSIEVGLLDLSTTEATEDELSLDARADLEATATDAVPLSRWARLQATWPGGAPPTLDRVRWMSTAYDTTFLELDATTTDWATAGITFDDLEIEQSVPTLADVTTVLALSLDGAGGNAVTAHDVDIGELDSLVRVGGRLLSADVAVDVPARLRARLIADDNAPCGLGLVDLRPADASPPPLPCDAPSDPFDPNALLDGRCTRADVVDADVIVEITP